MLKDCLECGMQVSEKAVICPHCGCPLKETSQITYRRQPKHRRLPNGFGQISEVKKQNLRKPFRVMVTTGKTETGKPICKLLKPTAYFATYNEAYEALLEYNRNPYSLDSQITVKELFDLWSEEYEKRNHKTSVGSMYISAWKYCESLYEVPVRELKTWQIKKCIDTSTRMVNGKERKPSENIRQWMKFLLSVMLDYAVEYELTDRNYARVISSKSITDVQDTPNEPSHIAFTEDELNLLWESVYTIPYVDVLLIQCYSGWRPQELGLIRLENIDLEKNLIIGGLKTKAGINRIVPIHSKIQCLIEKKYKEAINRKSAFLLFSDKCQNLDTPSFTYTEYRKQFIKILKKLNLNHEHRPHDGRKTFITLAKKYKVDEYAIKYIVGHAINDLTEHTYTERSSEWLSEEIEKIE